MTVAYRYLVSGRVQDVGFRYFTQSAALDAGVTGWVRNLPDGRVEVYAEGSADALAVLADALKRGPAAARVSEVEAESAAPSGHPDFRVTA